MPQLVGIALSSVVRTTQKNAWELDVLNLKRTPPLALSNPNPNPSCLGSTTKLWTINQGLSDDPRVANTPNRMSVGRQFCLEGIFSARANSKEARQIRS